jgi:hypothetical protein
MYIHLYKYNSTCRDLIIKVTSHPCFYGDVIAKAEELKSVRSHRNRDRMVVVLCNQS